MNLENFLDGYWLIFFQTMKITNFFDKRYFTPLILQNIWACPQNNLIAKYDEYCTKDIAKSIIEIILKNLLAQ